MRTDIPWCSGVLGCAAPGSWIYHTDRGASHHTVSPSAFPLKWTITAAFTRCSVSSSTSPILPLVPPSLSVQRELLWTHNRSGAQSQVWRCIIHLFADPKMNIASSFYTNVQYLMLHKLKSVNPMMPHCPHQEQTLVFILTSHKDKHVLKNETQEQKTQQMVETDQAG